MTCGWRNPSAHRRRHWPSSSFPAMAADRGRRRHSGRRVHLSLQHCLAAVSVISYVGTLREITAPHAPAEHQGGGGSSSSGAGASRDGLLQSALFATLVSKIRGWSMFSPRRRLRATSPHCPTTPILTFWLAALIPQVKRKAAAEILQMRRGRRRTWLQRLDRGLRWLGEWTDGEGRRRRTCGRRTPAVEG